MIGRRTAFGLAALAGMAAGAGCAGPGESSGPVQASHASSSAPAAHAADSHLARAESVLRGTPLIDGHNDVPWNYRRRVQNHVAELDFESDLSTLEPPMHTDIPRLREGLVGGQFWSVYIPAREGGWQPGDARIVLEQIDLTKRLVDRHSNHLELARSADDVERAFRAGRIASLMGMEGGQSIENSLAVLRSTYELGARYLTLTHSRTLDWADSATDEARHGGLTAFGREVVREMNRLGMIVDLSHVSAETMHDALDVSRAPVIFSHSSARAVCDSPRNVPDDVLLRMMENGGVIMITFVPVYVSEDLRLWYEALRDARESVVAAFPDDEDARRSALDAWRSQNPEPRVTVSEVADHIDHVRDLIGSAHIGIGGDYDGVGWLPEGLEDVSGYPNLFAELSRRGYTDEELRAIAGENILRVMREVERIGGELRAVEAPSDALIEELDGDASSGVVEAGP